VDESSWCQHDREQLPVAPSPKKYYMESVTSSCSSATFPAHGAPHERVCGKWLANSTTQSIPLVPTSSCGVHVDGAVQS